MYSYGGCLYAGGVQNVVGVYYGRVCMMEWCLYMGVYIWVFVYGCLYMGVCIWVFVYGCLYMGVCIWVFVYGFLSMGVCIIWGSV